MPLTLASKPESYWILYLAIAQARSDPREAPWYGPWDVVLQELFRDFCPGGFTTVTYPQFPLVQDIDTYNLEEESDEDEELDDQAEFPGPRFTAPSPEVFKGYRADLPQTPPKLLTPDRKMKQIKKRSTRIPDFVQLLFQIKVKNPGSILDDPPKHRNRILLLVEIKRALISYEMYDFIKVLDQTDQQARHAFASYPEVNTFGLIIALGDHWTYREYNRESLRPSPTRFEHSDPTFEEPRRDPELVSKIYPDVDRIFGAKGFACLQKPESDEALFALRRCLTSLSALMLR